MDDEGEPLADLALAIHNLIDTYTHGHDLCLASVVGVLELVKADIVRRAQDEDEE